MKSKNKLDNGITSTPVRVHIAICHEFIHDKDAIGRDIFGMAKLLTGLGFKVTAVGGAIESFLYGVVDACLHVDNFSSSKFDALIYHHSTFWEEGEEILGKFTGPLLIRYHNVTPSFFFSKYSSRLEEQCIKGVKQTRFLIEHNSSAFWASDSKFNKEELIELGVVADRVKIVAPFNNTSFSPVLENNLKKHKRRLFRVIFVGRTVPNKRIDSLLRVVASYIKEFDNQIVLDLVGNQHPEMSSYFDEIRDLVANLQIEEFVHWHGFLSDQEVDKLYRNSDAFLCMSEHEGFCVPLIEAQSVGLPVVACDAGAVSETLGEEQLVSKPPHTDEDYLLYAHLINEVRTNEELRNNLKEQGYRNYMERFSKEKIADSFVEALEPVLRQIIHG
ncbi:glycosyltransferase family 4 protein [Opitutales bacterium]|nr:glycosyltransferase family 4 protein [Opitutales bacterium]